MRWVKRCPLLPVNIRLRRLIRDTSTSRSVEYRSTGVILTVTPRINERGLVAMDVNQEVSKAVTNTISGIESPSITNRKAETSLVVQDGQTIIIGGLIIDETSDSQIRRTVFIVYSVDWLSVRHD